MEMIIKINKINRYGNYPIFNAIENNDKELVKLIIDYANDKNIILNIEERCNDNNNSPIILAISNNNTEITKLILNYSSSKYIILRINEKKCWRKLTSFVSCY